MHFCDVHNMTVLSRMPVFSKHNIFVIKMFNFPSRSPRVEEISTVCHMEAVLGCDFMIDMVYVVL